MGPGQNKNHTLSPTDFGMKQTRTFVAQRCFHNFTFDVSSQEIYVFKPFWPQKSFQRNANWVGGCFFHAELRDDLFPEFSDKLHTWQDICGFTLIPPEPWPSLTVEINCIFVYRIWNMKPVSLRQAHLSTGNISWLHPPPPHHTSVLRHPEVH